jgi:hypothetical protein
MNLSENCVKNVPSVDIEREYLSKSGAVGAGVVFLCVELKSLEMLEFETYEFERLFGGLEDDVLRDYVVRHQISRDITVNFVPSVKSD